MDASIPVFGLFSLVLIWYSKPGELCVYFHTVFAENVAGGVLRRIGIYRTFYSITCIFLKDFLSQQQKTNKKTKQNKTNKQKKN